MGELFPPCERPEQMVLMAACPARLPASTIISLLSGSKCLTSIHFLTDTSHFKAKASFCFFTMWFTRNQGL